MGCWAVWLAMSWREGDVMSMLWKAMFEVGIEDGRGCMSRAMIWCVDGRDA